MSVRTQILVLPVVVALTVALLMGGGMYLTARHGMSILRERDLGTAQSWLEASITRTHKIALAQAEVIAALPVVQAAVAAEDDMALERLLGPGFDHMRDAAGVVQLQFHLAPATSLIRIHNLEKRGDDLSAFRKTVVDANASGASLSGLERGRAGIGARGVAVIQHEGRPVGTVEVGLDIGLAFLEGLADRSGNEFEFYLVPDGEIDTFAAADPAGLRLGATFDGDPLLTPEDLSGTVSTGGFDRAVRLGDRDFALRAVPIRDYSGAVAGIVSLLVPVDGYAVIGRQLLTTTIGSAVAALVLGCIVGFLSGHVLARRFAGVVLTVERLAREDPDLVVTGTDRNDEIGGILRALKMFQTRMRENSALARALKQEEAAKRVQEEAVRVQAETAAEARRAAEAAEAQRQHDLAAARARTAQAEQAAAEARMREQQEVVDLLAAGLDALAAGDLTHEITRALPGDYEMLRRDFNRATAELRSTMQSLDGTAAGIDDEVAAVAQASDELARRSERNAARLEETAAALDELTASVHAAADSAAEARRLIDVANRNADDGNASVIRAVAAMNRIAESSRGIARITSVIDEIAFQTNLLALNAGVEAARAGEAGRGFAVVASEVRALAQRSSEAAREISGLIGTSETEVAQGVDLVGQTGAALERILASVREISDQVILIANSSQEQALGLGEINSAVNQLDGTTQQNAAMLEETNAATSVLNRKTGELVAAIGRFRTSGTGDAPGWRDRADAGNPVVPAA